MMPIAETAAAAATARPAPAPVAVAHSNAMTAPVWTYRRTPATATTSVWEMPPAPASSWKRHRPVNTRSSARGFAASRATKSAPSKAISAARPAPTQPDRTPPPAVLGIPATVRRACAAPRRSAAGDADLSVVSQSLEGRTRQCVLGRRRPDELQRIHQSPRIEERLIVLGT